MATERKKHGDPSYVGAGGAVAGREQTHAAKKMNGGTVIEGTFLAHVEDRFRLGSYSAEGKPGVTGVVARDAQGNIVATVRHPGWVTKEYKKDGDKTEVVWGGEQTRGMIEVSFLRSFGAEGAAVIAKDIVETAKVSTDLPYDASVRGSEVESFLTSKAANNRGQLVAAPLQLQEELQTGVFETALPPSDSIEEGMFMRAQLVRAYYDRPDLLSPEMRIDEDVLRVNTSVPITGTFHTNHEGEVVADPGTKINQGEYKDYVGGMSDRLMPLMGRFDPISGQMADLVAQVYGYSTFEELHAGSNDMAYWLNTSAHQSTSLPHLQDEKGENIIPTEIAIGVADIQNSSMAKVAGLLMFSSPFILGEDPKIVQDGNIYYPRDGRDLLRRSMATSIPGENINTVEELNRRTENGIIAGHTHTMDRTAYTTQLPDGTESPSYHGPVRIRMARPKPDSTIGRVEVTEAGNTFSLLDYYAFTTIVDALKLGAFEAAAHGQHPSEYFGEKYPLITQSDKRVAIGDGYNLRGPNDPLAREAIVQMSDFLGEMADTYEPFKKNITFAQERVKNLLTDTKARTFEEYLVNPVGQVSEVMRHMREDGHSHAEIAEKATWYENEMAKRILKNQGDATKVYAAAA